MILYESKMAKVEWLEKQKIVTKAFLGFIYGEDMQKAFDAGAEALKKNKGTKWLSDNSKLQPYRQEDMKWINEDWFPRVLASGWKYWAVIEPENILGQLSMKTFIEAYQKNGITLKIFRTVAEALAWLESV